MAKCRCYYRAEYPADTLYVGSSPLSGPISICDVKESMSTAPEPYLSGVGYNYDRYYIPPQIIHRPLTQQTIFGA